MRVNKSSKLRIFHFDFNFVSLWLDYLRKWISKVADMGYNAILWEIEDKVRLDTLGDIAYCEAMSKDEFRKLLEYSKSLGLEPIPLVQTFGHGEYVMKHEKYHSFREQAGKCDCYCTSNPDVKNFLVDLVCEVVDLFGKTRYVHLGGDEAYVFGTCEKCKAYADKHSPNQLYADHLNHVARPIIDRGIRPGIWCDMVLHYPDDIECISKEFVIWDWNYWDGVDTPQRVRVWGTGSQTAEELDESILQAMPEILTEDNKLKPFYTVEVLKRLGYDIILCSSIRSAGDSIFCGRHYLHASNVVGAARTAERENILGHCVTSWAVRIFNYELQENWIQLACLSGAELEKDYDELLGDEGQILFGCDPTNFYKAINLIASGFMLTVSSGSYASGIQWSNLKDSLPTPKDYLKNKLEEWKSNAPDHYANLKEMFEKAFEDIPAGKQILKNFSSNAKSGQEIIEQWITAADFQLALLRIVKQVYVVFEDQSHDGIGETINMISKIKSDYEKWASQWMTPKNANENTALIFDDVFEFFKTYKV